jgi:hypothetical protein
MPVLIYVLFLVFVQACKLESLLEVSVSFEDEFFSCFWNLIENGTESADHFAVLCQGEVSVYSAASGGRIHHHVVGQTTTAVSWIALPNYPVSAVAAAAATTSGSGAGVMIEALRGGQLVVRDVATWTDRNDASGNTPFVISGVSSEDGYESEICKLLTICI